MHLGNEDEIFCLTWLVTAVVRQQQLLEQNQRSSTLESDAELQSQTPSSLFCPLIFEFVAEKCLMLQQNLTLDEDLESTSPNFCAGGVTAKLEESATTLVSKWMCPQLL